MVARYRSPSAPCSPKYASAMQRDETEPSGDRAETCAQRASSHARALRAAARPPPPSPIGSAYTIALYFSHTATASHAPASGRCHGRFSGRVVNTSAIVTARAMNVSHCAADHQAAQALEAWIAEREEDGGGAISGALTEPPATEDHEQPRQQTGGNEIGGGDHRVVRPETPEERIDEEDRGRLLFPRIDVGHAPGQDALADVGIQALIATSRLSERWQARYQEQQHHQDPCARSRSRDGRRRCRVRHVRRVEL